MVRKLSALGACTAMMMFVSGCVVGPQYHSPAVQTPPAYKETVATATPAPVDSSTAANSAPGSPAQPGTTGQAAAPPAAVAPTAIPFRVATPSDSLLRGNWWEMFNDPQLNTLEEQVNVSNQTIAQAVASYYSARAIVRESRTQFFPTASVAPSIARSRGPNSSNFSGTATFSLPAEASWVPDLFGRVHNQVSANEASAQVSAADLENIRLTIHTDLAFDYFELRGQDNLKQLLDSTVTAYQQSLDLTRALYETGIDSDEAVAQAETQLNSALAQNTATGILRAQLEHAIAVLVGQPPSTFSIPVMPQQPSPPTIPVSAPSDLLERRPDIAAAERQMAQANSLIGVATAAYYPTVSLSGSVGFTASAFTDWFAWPNRVWSVGSSLAETVFDAGLRKATVQQYRGLFDQDVAIYRQTILAAFQQVEDNLSTSRILAQEVQQQDTAVASAQRNLNLATDRYRLGIDPYLNVITAETTYLTNQQSDVNLHTQQMTAAVDLIEALGGGWNLTELPSMSAVAQVNIPATPAAATAPASGTPSNR